MTRPPRDPDDMNYHTSDGLLDPARTDVGQRPKRKRRNRKLPDPPPELRAWEKAAEKRLYARPIPPNIILEPAGFDEERWTAPHSDRDLWTLQLADAFGTRSRAVISTFMRQLEALCRPNHWDDDAKQWRLDEHEYSAVLGIVASAKPRNELEAAQVAQMVAIHLLTMKVAARAIRFEYDTRTAAVSAKLARTFTLQMEALQTGRRRKPAARQTITVRKETHQHVHYHDNRGAAGNERQPQGRTISAADKCAALPSPDEGGNVLPLSSRKGQAKV
jgi:hypothetical protein